MFKKSNYLLYFILFSSLFIGYIFKENASGGAKIDFNYLFPFIDNFNRSISDGFNFYLSNEGSKIHSPIFYIIVAFFLKIIPDLNTVNLIYILLCSCLPYLFFKILSLNFGENKNYLFYFSLILFLSPYFRSSAIWLLGDNLSLIFYSLFVIFYIQTEKNSKDIKNYFFCALFIILCSYVRYYYCLFYLLIFYKAYKELSLIHFLYLLFFSFVISLPAFLYFFIIIKHHNFFSTLNSFGTMNYLNNTIIIYTILLFYIFPIILFKVKEIFNYYVKNLTILLFVFFILSLIFIIDTFFINDFFIINNAGGGVLKKFIELFNFKNKFLIFIPLFVSIIFLDYIFKSNRIFNYSLLCILILCLSLNTIYQKYLDPLFFLILFGLVKSSLINELIKKNLIKLPLIYFYFSSFLIFAIIYY